MFYLRGNGRVMEVPIDTKNGFNKGTPRELFRGSYVRDFGEATSWDIYPDGKRFLMIKQPEAAASEEAPRKIRIVANWFEELKQPAPVP